MDAWLTVKTFKNVDPDNNFRKLLECFRSESGKTSGCGEGCCWSPSWQTSDLGRSARPPAAVAAGDFTRRLALQTDDPSAASFALVALSQPGQLTSVAHP